MANFPVSERYIGILYIVSDIHGTNIGCIYIFLKFRNSYPNKFLLASRVIVWNLFHYWEVQTAASKTFYKISVNFIRWQWIANMGCQLIVQIILIIICNKSNRPTNQPTENCRCYEANTILLGIHEYLLTYICTNQHTYTCSSQTNSERK